MNAGATQFNTVIILDEIIFSHRFVISEFRAFLATSRIIICVSTSFDAFQIIYI